MVLYVALDNMNLPNDCYYLCYVVCPLSAASSYRKTMNDEALELHVCHVSYLHICCEILGINYTVSCDHLHSYKETQL